MRSALALTAILLGLASAGRGLPAPPEPRPAEVESIVDRIAPPLGFDRAALTPGSYAAWLRERPLRPGRPPVRLFDGRLKANQSAHVAVLDLEVGDRDLQQCADAVIRLRAEFLRDHDCEGAIAFDFTSGDRARWEDWRSGWRPEVSGNRVTWRRSAAPDPSAESFHRYLETVFTYAGTASLERELEPVEALGVEPGDVFVQGGFPGHAVLVVDVALGPAGQRAFLLAQSFMPAQQIHLLRNPRAHESPWYLVGEGRRLVTPEWVFDWRDRHRFPAVDCEP